MKESSPLTNFSGEVGLFPLPNLVLFPSVLQPLHVFEPRYRQLMQDALSGDRLLGLVLLKPGWEEEYHLRPPIHSVACLGEISNEERLPDGRYNLLLHGLKRVEILEELPEDKLYRVGRVRLLEEIAAEAVQEAQLREELTRRIPQWFAGHKSAMKQAQQLMEGGLTLGNLCDVFSFALPLDSEPKQQLLEELDVARRTRLLLSLMQLEELPMPRSPRRFPPEFSQN